MRKIYIAICLLVISFATAYAQPTVLGTHLVNGSYATYNYTYGGAGTSFTQFRIQASSSAASNSGRQWEFAGGTAGSPSYNPVWRPYTSGNVLSVNTYTPTTFANGARFNGGGGASGELPAIIANNYYTFNVYKNTAADNIMQLLETNFNPTTISTVTQSPTAAAVQANNAVAVTITTATAPSVGENIFVRYSTNGFTNSTLVQATFVGTAGTAIIPCGATAVSYYVYSSNKTLAQIQADVTLYAPVGEAVHDMSTLSINNNGGTNYSYTPIATTSFAGSYSIPGTCYATIQAFVTAINGGTITGPVTVYVAAGHTETAAPTGISLTATGTAANTIKFIKSGIGTNPTINAGVGTATPVSAAPDGIFRLNGSDYVTIDGFTFTDGNAANPATMEYGIGLFKNSVTDGASNNTIQNCTFNMQRINNASASGPMVDGAVGILVINSTAIAATTALTPTTALGTNSNNKFYTNTINGGNVGIALSGYAALTPFTLGDVNNDIGGNAAGTGNSILNFGGGAVTNPAAGIRANNQFGTVNISYNTINNNNGSGLNHATTLRGIYAQAGTSANANINFNTITLKSAATTSSIYAIDNTIGSTAAGNTVNINNNNITGSYLTATTGSYWGIIQQATSATTNINNNNISNIIVGTSAVASVATFYGIQNSVGNGTNPVNINGNTISGNIINNQGGSIYAIRATTCAHTSNNNTITNNTIPLTGGTLSSGIYGIYNIGSPTIETFTGNTITGSSISGASTSTISAIYGIYLSTTAASVKNISSNAINSFSFNNSAAGAATLFGISTSSGTSILLSKNKIYSLVSNGASSTVSGIYLGSGTTITAQNNYVGDLRTPAANAAIPVAGINIAGGTTANLYYNTVYLNATSTGALFGSSAVYGTSTAVINLRNNILVNASTGVGASGFNAAYRRSGAFTATNHDPLSNNNLFFAGTPSAKNLISYDNVTSNQTLAAYKTQVGPTRDAASVTENPTFLSTTGSAGTYLHINPATATQIEGGAAAIAGITDDYDGDTRPLAPATAPDIGADEFVGIPANPVITLSSFVVTPATVIPGVTAQCTATGRDVIVNVTTASGSITAVTISGNNGVAFGPIAMTNISGTLWKYTIPAATTPVNAAVTWSVTATNSGGFTKLYTGTGYSDVPLFGAIATATATPTAICSGSPTSLNVALSQSGTATIGTGTTLTSATTQPTAFCNRWLGHRSQVIFTATELIAAGLTAGNISSMAYNITTLGDAATNANFTVRIGGTLLTNFTAATFEPITGFTTCFPAATYTHTGTGWQTISFSTPYNWNGTSNIIVDVSMDGANATNNSQTYFTATPGNSVLYTTTSVSATVTLSTTRLNVRFAGNTTLTPTAYSWSDGSTVVGTTNPLNQSPAVNTSYTATATVSGCPIVSNAVAVTVNPLPTAPTGTNSSQCGTAIPTASVADLNGFGATRLFKWYDAAIGGTLLQSNISATYLSNVGPSTTIFYVTVTNPITGCESARTPVTISIVAAPTLTITGNQVACNNQIYSMSVTPILPAVLSDYDSYKWSPITNLYTDAAATIAYTTGTSATTVYVKGTVAAATTYTCTSSNSISLCSNTATSTVAIQPVVTGYTVPTSTYCLSGTPTLTAIPATGYAASTLQWQSSTTALVGPYTDISGATNASYTPAAALNATIYYQLLVKDGTGAVCGTAPQTTITLNSPMATSLGDKTICGSGTVNLAVTAGGGANINWFAAATGGGIIGTGAIFTTPTINTTTSYYAQAELVSTGNATIGTATTTTGSISYPSAFANYDYQTWTQLVYTAAELQAAGLRAGNITSLSLNIAAKSNANPSGYSISLGTVGTSTLSAFTTTGLTQVFTSPSMATVVGLNNIPFSAVYNWDGISNILVDIRGTGAFGSSNATTYYTTQTNSVVYNYTGTSNATYWTSNPTPLVSSNRFNIIFAGQAATCVSSPRTQVQAIVTPAPAITAPANVSICAGSPTNLTVTSGNANYTYAWSPATGLSATTGATVTATPTTTQTYTITATDNISAPPVCVAISTVTVTVNPIPAGVTATAAPNPICAGSTINLTSTVTNPTTILTEGFETPPATWNNWSTSTFAPSNVWNVNTAATGTAHTGAGMAQYLYNSTNAANTYFMSPSQSLTAGLTYTISYWYRASSASFAENMKLTWGTTDNAGTHTNTLADHPSFVNTTWVQNTVTFVPAISGVYYFGWHAYSVANRFNIYLDDITITRNDNFSYAWTTTPAGFTSTVQNPTGVIPNNGDVYNVKVTNTSTTCFATASTAAVVVNPVPAEPIDGTTAAQCGAVTYTVTSAEATPTYKWYTAATGGVPVATNITGIYSPLVYNSPGSNVIYVSVSSAFCESPRKAITVTSSPSDPLTITAAQVACNNAYAEILITTPTSGAGSFASYVWSSPTAGVLFSDNAGTAYIAGTSVTSVFVRSATAGSITVNVVAVNGACSANTSTTVFVQPATATLNAPATTFCQTGSTTISASPAIGYAAGSLQWQSSTTGVAGSYTDIAGETGVTYTTPTLNNTIYYQLLVKNTAGISCVTPQITIIVNNPLITATTLGTRCGTGTVLLGATASTGTINWFAAASGGTSLGTGTSFTTLSITGTTTYYASASVGLPVNAVIGTGTALTSATGEITAFCNRRDSYWSQTVYTGAELSAAGLLAGNISSITYNIASIGDAATNANYTIKIGTSATTTLSAFTTVGLTDVYGPVTQTHAVGNNLINFSTPYVWDGVSNIIVDLRHEGIDAFNNAQTYITPTVGNTTVYAFSSSITSVAALVASNPAPTTSVNRLNTIFGQLGCESARTAVVATVTPPLALTIDKTTDAVCTGSSSVVTVNSTLANYDSYTWSGPAGTFVSSGTPAGALVTLTPTVNPTVYTLTANNSVTGCNNTATVTVTVNPIPSIPTNAIDYTLCQNTTIPGGAGLAVTTEQAVTSFTGSLVVGPTFVRGQESTTTYTASGVGTAVYFTTHTFKVSTTGSYTFNECSPVADGFAFIYQNSFNPASPATNFLIGNDDGNDATCLNSARLVRTLTAGTTYVLVTTSFNNGETGAYTWTFSGPGSILLPGGSAVWYTAATGGTSIGTGAIFNPIGVAGSGVPNSATAGSTTFYAAATSGLCESVRVPVVLTINPQPTATIAYTGTPYCAGGTATVTALGIGNTGGTYTFTPTGLVINGSTGDIDLTASTPGAYTITYTKAAVGVCAIYTTNTSVTIKATGTWLGVNTDWNNPANWCGGIPTSATNVIIPVVASGFYPIIDASAPLPYANNVSIAAAVGANIPIITVGTGATFNLNGTLSGAGLMDVVAGTINTTGTATTINGANLTSNTANTIKLSGNATIATGAIPVRVTNQIDFVTSGSTLTTNDNLVLVSTATGTANIGNVNGGSVVGKAEIQRFLPSVAQKSWRLLATPVVIATSPTITNSWREGGLDLLSTGFGTRVTGADGPFLTYAGVTGEFLDEYTVKSNMKSYSMTGDNFTDITGTDIVNSRKIANEDGYFLFVRGDRAVGVSIGGSAGSTTLRIKGDIRTGDQTFVVNAAPSAAIPTFRSVGNPFPSRIDMRTVNFNGISGSYYAWTPNRVGSFNVGSYILYENDFIISGGLVGSNNFNIVPAAFASATIPGQRNFIESGEAFFVQNGSTTVAGSLVIKEGDKATGSALIYASRTGVTTPTLEINLLSLDATGNNVVVDGAKINFNNSFDNLVDNKDIVKITNTLDNLGIKTAGKNLIVERRKIPQEIDTIQLNISALRTANFTIEIDPSVLSNAGVTAELKDRFLQTTTLVSMTDVTSYSFATTADANSKAANRFYIVFKPSGTLPVTFVDIAATKNTDNTNTVKWTIANEQNVQNYQIERSDRGTNFVGIGTQVAIQTSNYNFVDATPLIADNYYRIKAISVNGQIQYSPIVKIAANNKEKAIQIVVNPIMDNKVQLSFVNKAGKYNIALFNSLGQLAYTTSVNVASSNELKVLDISSKLVAGVYQLVVTNSNGEKTVLQALVK